MSYDLGTAHGKIDLDYEGGREAAQAQEDIEELRRRMERADESARRHDSAMGLLSKAIANMGKVAAIAGASSLALNGSLNALAATVAGVAALAPVAGAALAAIPGLALAGASSFAVFKAATAGVSDALAAATEDAEKFNEAIKGLSPNAQRFAKEWRDSVKALRPLQQIIQDTFFSGLDKELNLIVRRVQTLRTQSVRLADAFNQVTRRITEWLRSDTAIMAMGSSLEFARAVLVNMDGAIQPLLDSFARLAMQAERFGMDLGGLIATGMLRLAEIINNTDLADLFERASSAVQGLWGWLQDLGTIASEIWGMFNIDGGTALGIIGELTSRLAEFLQTAEGQAALEALGLAMNTIAGAAGQVFLTLLKELAPAIIAIAPGLGEFATQLANILVPALEAAGPLLEDFAKFLSENMDWVGPLALGIGGLAAAYKTYETAQKAATIAMAAWETAVKVITPLTRTLTAANLSLAASFLTNPYVLAAVAIIALVAAIVLIATKTDWFQRAWNWAWGGIKDAAQAVADWFTGTVVPLFSGAWDDISGFFTGAWDKIKGAFDAVKDGFQDFWDEVRFIFDGIRRVFESVWGLITEIVRTAWAIISAIFAVFVTVTRAIFEPILNWLTEAFKTAWEAVRNAITEVVDFLGPYLQQAWDFITGIIDTALTWIGDRASEAWDYIRGVFEDFWEPIQPYVEEAVDAVVGFVTGAWDRLKKFTSDTWEDIRNGVVNFWDNLKKIFTDGVDRIVGIIDGIRNIVTRIGDFFRELRTAAQGGTDSLIDFVRDIPGRILNALGDFGRLLFNAGQNLIWGLIDGISSYAGYLWDYAQDIANGILNTFSDIFRLGSPSKETHEYGEFLTIGLANGMEDALFRLQRAADAVAVAALPAVPSAAGVAGMSAGFVNHAEQAAMAAVPASAEPRSISIANLNISGVWDFTDPGASRRVAAAIHQALKDLEGEYR